MHGDASNPGQKKRQNVKNAVYHGFYLVAPQKLARGGRRRLRGISFDPFLCDELVVLFCP